MTEVKKENAPTENAEADDSKKVLRVQVGSKRFMRKELGTHAIEYMQEVSVTAELADKLDSLTYVDRANNELPMFVEPSDKKVVTYRKNVEESQAAVTRSRKRRSRGTGK